MSAGLRLCAAVLAAVLAGCGGNAAPPAPEDAALTRDQRLARLSFEQQRPEQAVSLYRQALAQAQRRDDADAIEGLGYDLAVALLRVNRPGEALATAQATRGEVERRGGRPRPELLLVQAAALYRSGEADAVADLAAAILALPDASSDVRGRAGFISGLVAADRGDAAGVRAALAQLEALAAAPPIEAPAPTPLTADRDELAGHLARLQGDPAGARSAFLAAADARRTLLDYPGMARSLAHAASAAEAQGRGAEAADLWLRAGRSAQLGGQSAEARVWLGRAREIAVRIGAADIAAEAVARLAAINAPPGAVQPSRVPGAVQPSREPGGSG
ncbi:MAG TPA: hypothetical protein VES39_06560 [Rhodospirillales bacterium]|nr:hypothetical protein [Rhodospirillales bacterium]